MLQCLQMELLTTVVNSQKYRHSKPSQRSFTNTEQSSCLNATSSLRTALDTVAPVKKESLISEVFDSLV